MKTILRSEIPKDFTYYRTGSKIFYEYYKKSILYCVDILGAGFQFLLAYKLFPGFWFVSIEKNDTEVTLSQLKKNGIRHGIIFWTPHRRIDKPTGWFQSPLWFTKRSIHSSRSAFSVLDREDYWNKWISSARSHRRHILKARESGKIRIDNNATIDQFLDYYSSTRLKDPNKGLIENMTKGLFKGYNKYAYRVFIAYVDNKPLAGAVFIDEGVTSEYWASFYSQESHPHHLGVALMDAWFLDSYNKGIRYCDLDHMRDSGQSFGFAGYTKFKESIVDHDVYFHDMWIKIF